MMVTDGAGNRDRLRAELERDSETMGQWDSGSELQPGSESSEEVRTLTDEGRFSGTVHANVCCHCRNSQVQQRAFKRRPAAAPSPLASEDHDPPPDSPPASRSTAKWGPGPTSCRLGVRVADIGGPTTAAVQLATRKLSELERFEI